MTISQRKAARKKKKGVVERLREPTLSRPYKSIVDDLQEGRVHLNMAIKKLVSGGMKLKRETNSPYCDPTDTDLARIDTLMENIRAAAALEMELAWIFGPMRKEPTK